VTAEVLPPGTRLASVVSSYHEEITLGMHASALAWLGAAGLPPERVLLTRVPGTFELPLVARRLARRTDVAAVLCFGLVLKGETEHDRHIARACAQGLMQVGLECDKPVLFGVLTCATLEQAQRRARRSSEGGLDKGAEVARAALEVLAALRDVQGAQAGTTARSEERR